MYFPVRLRSAVNAVSIAAAQQFRSDANEDGACRLVSRNRNAFRTFDTLAQAIGLELAGRGAILDGEIVRPGPDGRPMFYELMRRRGPFCFYTFDLLWLDTAKICGTGLCSSGKNCFGS